MTARKVRSVLIESTCNDELPGCCGVRVFYDLQGSNETFYSNDYDNITEIEYKKLSKEDKKDWYKDEEFPIELPEGRAVLATTIADQRIEIQALKDAGFKAVTSFKNPGTSNRVTVWFKKPKGQR